MKHSHQSSENELIQRLVDIEMESFAFNLSVARALWRKFPSLVQAKKFPEELACAIEGPADLKYNAPVDFAAPDFKKRLWRRSRRELMNEGAIEPRADAATESRDDDDFLRIGLKLMSDTVLFMKTS
jgi:hypothetical protein